MKTNIQLLESDQDKFIEQNIGLVYKIAQKFTGHGVYLDDLVQEGCIGLINAARAYEPDKGYEFSTYASKCVRGRIMNFEVNQSGSLNKPRHFKEYAPIIQKAIDSLSALNGHFPTIKQLSIETQISERVIIGMLNLMAGTISLSDFLYTSEDHKDLDINGLLSSQFTSPEQASEHNALSQALLDALNSIPEREALILKLRYIIRMSLDDIGHYLKVSKQAINVIEHRALNRLSSGPHAASLKEFLNN